MTFDGAHLHLLINHAPIFGSLFAFLLLVASFFAARTIEPPRQRPPEATP